jgi:peptide/nickel transport system substrate-binding protein
MLIESSPANLDLRVGTDAQSERIGSLIFDSLVRKDAHFAVQPWLAQSWDHPDPVTWVFHLRRGVRFHNGRSMTARDVKWTLDSVRNGTVITAKAQAFAKVASVEAPDPATVIVRLKQPDPFLLWNLSDGAIGIVPYGSGRDLWRDPIGTGPFRFLSQEQDRDVMLARNDSYWQQPPRVAAVRFNVVPDPITRALELQKGSADAEINSLSPDMVYALRRQTHLVIESAPGTSVTYLSFNLRDPLLRDVRVRKAIALALNRPLIIDALWRGEARLADSLLPPGHWARDGALTPYPYDPAQANRILDAAGYARKADGARFHLQMKISTADDSTRLMALVMQQQLRAVGIALDVRSFEFATFYADITKGAFSIYALRWIGGNESPDIFRYAYSASSLPPHGANRGYYLDPELDRLLADAAVASRVERQRADYVAIQEILARDVPSINLWYIDSVLVHTTRLRDAHPSRSGSYDFLRVASLAP